MLLIVVSGIVLRYLTPFVNLDLKDKLLLLQAARGDLDSAWGVVEYSAAPGKELPSKPSLAAGLVAAGLSPAFNNSPAGRVTILAHGVADIEYSIPNARAAEAQNAVRPGNLSQPHAFLGNNCTACHLEQQGPVPRATKMDHVALAQVGLKQIQHSPAPQEKTSADFAAWLISSAHDAPPRPRRDSIARMLKVNCATCH